MKPLFAFPFNSASTKLQAAIFGATSFRGLSRGSDISGGDNRGAMNEDYGRIFSMASVKSGAVLLA